VLRRIAIEGFKSLTEVNLELPQLVVLFGPNAAGKSNLLDAIQMLARAGTQRTLGDALERPIRGFPVEAFTLPPQGLPELLTAPSARFSIEADLEMPHESRRSDSRRSPDRIRYRMGVEIDPDAGVLTLADEYLTRMTREWHPKDYARIETVGHEVHIRRSSGGGAPRHDPLGVNHTYLSDTRLSGPSYPLFDLVRGELAGWRTHYLDPQTAMREGTPPREVSDIGVRGEYLAPFLYGLKTRRKQEFEAVRRALRSVIPAVTSFDVDLDTKRGTLDIQIEQDGTTFSSRVISEGTLRVLGICAIAVTSTNGLVAFEEPENGVQPQRLERIAELLTSVTKRGGAQLVVTSHSPEFVAAMLARALDDPKHIGLFGVGREGRDTVVGKMRHDPGLWTDEAINDLLTEPDDRDKMAAVIRRGWLGL
jgi:predicted ATPase